MHKTLYSLAITGVLLMSITACGEDELYAKIKDTENFKNADAVFVGEVRTPNKSGPARPEGGKPGPVSLHALVVAERIYKGDIQGTVCTQSIYPYLEYRKMGFPYLEERKRYLILAKKGKLSGYSGSFLDRYKIDGGACYTTLTFPQLIEKGK